MRVPLSSVADAALATLREPAALDRRAAAMLADVTSGAAFHRLLDTIADDPAALAEIAARSYRHALGFDKIILLSLLPLGQLRLHVWWPEREHLREHPHNHRYAAHSVVLAGSLRNHAYQESGSGMLYRRYRESSAVADARWRFEQVGEQRLGQVSITDMPAGTSYSMAPDLVHRIEVPAGLTATLFLETGAVRDWSTVYVAPGDAAPAAARVEPYTPAQLRERLVRLRDGLGGPPLGRLS